MGEVQRVKNLKADLVLTVCRKEFIRGALAFGAAPFVPAFGAEEKPLWTAGLMTDTHVGNTVESCRLVKLACELFAEQGVDLVVNCGDIADHHEPQGYRILRSIYDTAFAKKHPQEIWVYAYHDFHRRQNEPYDTVAADIQKGLGAANGPYASYDFHGTPLIVVPQRIDYAKVEAMIREAMVKYPDPKVPIFVFDHQPPFNTTSNSITWGDLRRRALYARFPRVVVLTGHAHGSLRDETNVWQETFTTVNLGCLQVWSGHAVGGNSQRKKAYGVILMEVYRDRIVFRRFDVRDRSEYHASMPWCVPLPFDPATAPYRRVATAKTEPVPQFASDAALSLSADEDEFRELKLEFPRAWAPDGTYMYRLEIADENGVKLARQDVFGQFWLPEKDRATTLTYTLSAGYFEEGKTYKVNVTPLNCFMGEGRPLTAMFKAPRPFGIPVWKSEDPMTECPFMTELEGGKPVGKEDGWYRIGGGAYRLEFPKDAWAGKKDDRFRFVVDLETEQKDGGVKTWTIVLRSPKPASSANARIATPYGKSGRQRIVIEFVKPNEEYIYHLLVREGGVGRIRFNRVSIERIAVKHVISG